ncbi:MAG: hypothetical protein Q9213_004679 [Squamulea squamosa]
MKDGEDEESLVSCLSKLSVAELLPIALAFDEVLVDDVDVEVGLVELFMDSQYGAQKFFLCFCIDYEYLEPLELVEEVLQEVGALVVDGVEVDELEDVEDVGEVVEEVEEELVDEVVEVDEVDEMDDVDDVDEVDEVDDVEEVEEVEEVDDVEEIGEKVEEEEVVEVVDDVEELDVDEVDVEEVEEVDDVDVVVEVGEEVEEVEELDEVVELDDVEEDEVEVVEDLQSLVSSFGCIQESSLTSYSWLMTMSKTYASVSRSCLSHTAERLAAYVEVLEIVEAVTDDEEAP